MTIKLEDTQLSLNAAERALGSTSNQHIQLPAQLQEYILRSTKSKAKFCSAHEVSTRSIEGFHFEESRFYLVLSGKETVKTFSTNVLIRVECSFVGKSFLATL